MSLQELVKIPGEVFGSLLDFVRREFGIGRRTQHVLIVNIANANTAQQISPTPLEVRDAVIQHIGATTANVITVSDNKNITASVGMILNPPTTSGFGGGSMALGNIDLSTVWIASAGTGNYLAVYYLQ